MPRIVKFLSMRLSSVCCNSSVTRICEEQKEDRYICNRCERLCKVTEGE